MKSKLIIFKETTLIFWIDLREIWYSDQKVLF